MMVAKLVIAALTVSYKVAAVDDMNLNILITYRYMIASILTFPLAFFLERNMRQKPTLKILFQVFASAFFGCAQSMILTSTSFVATFTNLIPLFTFVIAVILRHTFLPNLMEKVGRVEITRKAKIIGTIVGVMILTFYKGHNLTIKLTLFPFERKHGINQNDSCSGSHIGTNLFNMCCTFFHFSGNMFSDGSIIDDTITSASLAGSVMIVAGLYMVIWGKAKEAKHLSNLMSSSHLEEVNPTLNVRVQSKVGFTSSKWPEDIRFDKSLASLPLPHITMYKPTTIIMDPTRLYVKFNV
ncbi:hypothetical protein E3N88_28785 [Mikania micrantha]|uniref:WAT1-related protein n=1 Tax=Mikania micrantha TaxID=192012 RepID=A0A5N6N231_9ASTR|nr:hypothetical protein E3N88_28785 [Mikania micrantha]